VEVANQVLVDRALQLLTAVISIALIDSGWRLTTGVGESVRVARGDTTVDVHVELQKMRAGKMLSEEWRAWCVA
jgi:hypothetical protein